MFRVVRRRSAFSSTSRLKSWRMRWTVSEPIATAKPNRITNVSAAETPARRTLMGRRSKAADTRAEKRRAGPKRSGPEDVAGSPDRVQQARLTAGLELAPQVGDEHLDRVRGREGVI